MKYFLNSIYFFLLVFSSQVQGQFQLRDSIGLDYHQINHLQSNDNGDVFFVADEKWLLKVDSNQSIQPFPLKKILSRLDTTLRLRTALVYNYQELEILDDRLNPIQDPINLNNFGVFPSALTIADSQILWYFDPLEQRLVQWNYQLKTMISKSNILFFKENDSTIEEIYLIKNRLFLKSQNWLYEYDIFGNFKSEISLKPHLNYSFSGNYIYIIDQESITSINLITRDISSLDNFFNGKDFTMSGDQIFVIKNKGLYIYTRIKK